MVHTAIAASDKKHCFLLRLFSIILSPFYF
nr:MAG TPA: hypothetical protein [Caudoviricetes sp.]